MTNGKTFSHAIFVVRCSTENIALGFQKGSDCLNNLSFKLSIENGICDFQELNKTGGSCQYQMHLFWVLHNFNASH